MAIIVNCPCGRKLKINEEFAGKEGTCPACGRVLPIPSPDDDGLREEDVLDVVAANEPEAATPSAEINNHADEPLPNNADFFVEAPAEIGPLVSAYTTLRQGKRPWPLWIRLLLSLFLCMAGFVIGASIDACASVQSFIWMMVWPVGLAAVGALGGLWASSFTHTCTYIGRDGVARFVCSGRRDKITISEVFRFRDATELRTGQTRHYRNSVYQNTTYKFTWSDVGGRQRYQIVGSHNNEAGNPPSTDFYHFGRATEFAWTMYLLQETHHQIELGGGVKFQLGKNQWIKVCPGKLQFLLRGEEEEWDAQEVGAAIIDNGVVKIKRTDAQEGWFSSTGVIKFSFDQLANAQLFFHLLDKLVGVEAR